MSSLKSLWTAQPIYSLIIFIPYKYEGELPLQNSQKIFLASFSSTIFNNDSNQAFSSFHIRIGYMN